MKSKKTISVILAVMLAMTAAVVALAESADTTTPAAAATTSASQADVEAAMAKYNAAKQANELSDLKTELDAMVQAGTLTQEEADAVYSNAASGVAMQKYRSLSKDATANDPLASYKAELDAMVAAGQLTQDEADLLYQKASETGTSSAGFGRGQRGQNGFDMQRPDDTNAVSGATPSRGRGFNGQQGSDNAGNAPAFGGSMNGQQGAQDSDATSSATPSSAGQI
jgi:hypothetical protein